MKQISVGKQQQPVEQRHGNCVHIEISIYIYVTVIGSLSHVAWILVEIFFFHSFIGCSSCDIQYKFIIQHTHTQKKNEEKTQKG